MGRQGRNEKWAVLIWCIGMVVLLTMQPVNSQSSDAPFLYYHSAQDDAFIIERADGSDSRILAPYILPATDTSLEVIPIITGAGWSPSGQWFAWRASAQYGGISRAYVAHRSGSESYTLLDGTPIAVMNWSPVDDILRLMVRASDAPFVTYDAYLVDMITPESPVQIMRDGTMANLTSVDIHGWSPGGYYAYAYALMGDGLSIMHVTNRDGQQFDRRFYREELGCFNPVWSHDEQVAYVDRARQNLVIEDFTSETISRIPFPAGYLLDIRWSPDNRYALVYLMEECSTATIFDNLDIYLLSMDTLDLTLLTETGSSENRFTFEWWLDSDYAYFHQGDDTIRVVSAETRQITQASPLERGYARSTQSLADGRLAYLWQSLETRQDELFVYNPGADTIEPLLPTFQFSSAHRFAVSSDLRYVAVGHSMGLTIANMLDGSNMTISYESLPGSLNQPVRLDTIEWHPNSNWLLRYSWEWVNQPIVVLNAEDMTQRVLSGCAIPILCLGWLPDVDE